MIILVLTGLLILGIILPFLPGESDRLAEPLSIIIQLFGVVGLPLSLLGLLWLLMPRYRFLFTNISIVVGSLIMLLIALFAMLSAGKILGIITITALVYILIQLRKKFKHAKASDGSDFSAVPFYLISLPVLALIAQMVLAKPVTQWSRNRAIENANGFIGHIEDFNTNYGHYPQTLQAMYKDYFPDIVGIEKYHYLPYGDSYNLSFEMPRFLLDNIGTREWVVYNPIDEHRVYSHTSWFLLLSPMELERSQGWYTSGNAGQPHWKYFLFD